MTDILNINDLCVHLQGKVILSNVQLTLSAGDILGLVGSSGCGKTTLLNTIAGFIEQEQGQIVIGNTLTITPNKTIPPQDRNVGMIFQDYALFPHLTVEQNICFGIDKLAKTEQQLRLNNLVKLLELTKLEKRFPHQLSGGQQQRVAIARALAPQPKLLLLDEPFSNIDARLRNELMRSMRHLLKSLNITAIFVTHNKDEVFTFADTISVMHQGTILQTGSPASVCQQPINWQVADFLQLGSWIPLKIQSSRVYQTALGEIPFLETMLKKRENNAKEIQSQQLLLKPHYIEVCSTSTANVQVDHIAITEQGYHYLCSSLTPNTEFSFEQLSYYSNKLYILGQQIALTIKAHDFVVFDK